LSGNSRRVRTAFKAMLGLLVTRGVSGDTLAPHPTRRERESSMDAISSISAAGRALGAPSLTAASTGAAPGASFGDALKDVLEGVNRAQADANEMGKRFQLGDTSVSLEETMIAMQKSSISFQAVVQARNRLMSAYHDIMNMSV